MAGAVHVMSTSPAVQAAAAVKVCGAEGVVCARALLTNRDVELAMANSATMAIVARNARRVREDRGMMRVNRSGRWSPLALGYQTIGFMCASLGRYARNGGQEARARRYGRITMRSYGERFAILMAIAEDATITMVAMVQSKFGAGAPVSMLPIVGPGMGVGLGCMPNLAGAMVAGMTDRAAQIRSPFGGAVKTLLVKTVGLLDMSCCSWTMVTASSRSRNWFGMGRQTCAGLLSR